MKDNKILIAIVVFALLLIGAYFAGFFTAKYSYKPVTVEKTTIVTDTIYDVRVLREYVPDIRTVTRYLPSKTDTIFNEAVTTIDTTAIISEFITRRDYAILIDTAGVVVELEPTVQFNRLQSIPYRLIRTDKELTTIERKRVVIPFVSASCLTNDFDFGIGGGLFYHNLGLEYQYLPTGSRHSIGVKYKF